MTAAYIIITFFALITYISAIDQYSTFGNLMRRILNSPIVTDAIKTGILNPNLDLHSKPTINKYTANSTVYKNNATPIRAKRYLQATHAPSTQPTSSSSKAGIICV